MHASTTTRRSSRGCEGRGARSRGYLVFDDTSPTTGGVIGHDLIDVWKRATKGCAGEFETHHCDVPDGFGVARRR
jgi:hypothetical protein